MIRRCAARILNRLADILFRLGDRLISAAYALDPCNELIEDLAREAEDCHNGGYQC